MKKANYGIDAPKVITILVLLGIFIITTTILFPIIRMGEVVIITRGFIFPGVFLLIAGILMILYSKVGKMRHRDRIIDMIDWKGSEKVLDVGTGLGLLMIGAAKKLTTGTAIGIDIFNPEDLSHNSIQGALLNAKIENVESKVEILSMNILKTTFPNDYFDVILSNLCLHNIEKSEDRKAACAEIYRILKPNGRVIISDFKKLGEYKKKFNSLGMKVWTEGTYFFDTFPPLTVISAVKSK